MNIEVIPCLPALRSIPKTVAGLNTSDAVRMLAEDFMALSDALMKADNAHEAGHSKRGRGGSAPSP